MRYEGNLTDHSGNLLSHIYCWINTHVFYTFKLDLQGNSNHIRQMDNLSSPYQNGLMFLVLIPTHFQLCLFLTSLYSLYYVWFLLLTFWAIQTCYWTTVSHSTHLLRGRQKACRYKWFDLIYILFCVIFTSIWISNNAIW